jgi:NAD(P)-dependent dehydrogenase (short-subunit alcohol dehydrogenase family)
MASVLITGCSSGFGLFTALRFARAGDRVYATMRNPGRAPGMLRRAIEKEHLSISILRLDVCDPSSVDAALGEAGQVDVLVNNAGIELRSSIEDASEDDVRRQFETNVFGPVRMIHGVLPSMRERGRGTIVNVSSIAGLVARPFGGFYSATKHALEAISEALHFEVRPFGVRVVLIEPGQYGTRLLDNASNGRAFDSGSPYWETSKRFDERLKQLRPRSQMSDLRKVADLIYTAVHDPTPRLRYLAGDDAKMIANAYRGMEFERYEERMRRALDWQD